MSSLRSGLWLVLRACSVACVSVACVSESRDFGVEDSGLKGAESESSDVNNVANDGGLSGSDGSASSASSEVTSEGPEKTSRDEDSSDEDSNDDGPNKDETTTPSDTEASDGDDPSASETPDEQSDSDVASDTESETSSSEAGAPSGDCESDANCNDLNPCNGTETCERGECVAATWADDGSACELGNDAALRVCSNGNCILSICGDGYPDERSSESCDDGNAANGDGCTVSCAYTCESDTVCDDGLSCNGAEQCDDQLHACVPGVDLDDQTDCGDSQICHSGECVPEGCGNGELEDNEECDDGNLDDSDGCDADCTFTCTEDVQCDDASVCTGVESCDLETHTCVQSGPLDCAAPDECSSVECDPITGCYYPLIDGDGDGYAASELECGSDCDDGNPSVYAGAAELCDGEDNNCNGDTDETAPSWYPDCDGDGFAAAAAAGVHQCESPTAAPEECAGRGLVGVWTSVPPASGNEDCWDDSATVHPMNSTENDAAWSQYSIEGRPVSVDYDYNCDGVEEPKEAPTYIASDAYCSKLIFVTPIFVAAQLEVLDPNLVFLPEPVSCIGTDGWMADAPACGHAADWSYCSGWSGTCQRYTDSSHYQTCR